MNKVLILLVFILVQGTNLQAQNLVPNPSFEEYTQCPNSDNLIQYAAPWYNPTLGTSDFLHECNPSWIVDVPQNWFGYQLAKTGLGYAGICVFSLGNPPSYREYIAVKLNDTLHAGIKYYVTFYVSLADTVWYATDDIGAYFSKDSIYSSIYTNLSFTQQISNVASNFLTDKINWVQVSGEFIALGGEQYMVIGNFRNNETTDTIKVIGGGGITVVNGVYFYIDDICVSDNPDTCNVISFIERNSLENIIMKFPNPVKNNLRLNFCFPEKKIKIWIYDSFGRVVYENIAEIIKEKEIEFSNLSEGVYFLKTQIDNKTIVSKIIHIK